nr:hypothetical protein [Tanacetum cinerariifolium]
MDLNSTKFICTVITRVPLLSAVIVSNIQDQSILMSAITLSKKKLKMVCVESLVLHLLAVSKKEHHSFTPRCEPETNSGVRIEPKVTLFRVFQTLCKQGDWFSFAKHRVPYLVCIDDNHSCMKHWKSGFFLIDRHDISDAMLRDMPESILVLSGLIHIWKSHVCDLVLWGVDGNVTGIHDFLCLPKWTGAEVQEEPYLDVSPTLQRLPFYYTPPAAAEAVIPDLTLEDLSVGIPSFKIVAKAEASQKRKASTSGVASSHVAKRTRSALAQSSGSTNRPSLFVSDDDESDDDACVEIPLVTPLCSAAVIPFSGNQDSQSKSVMVDDAIALSSGVSRPRPSFRPAPSFKDMSAALQKQAFGLNEKLISSDASFAKSKAKGKERKKKIKSLGKSLDNLYAEVARLSAALNQATILEAKKDEDIPRLKNTPSEFSSFFWGQFAGFERGLSMKRTKDEFATVLKKMVNFMSGAQDMLAEASPLLLQLTMPFLTRFLIAHGLLRGMIWKGSGGLQVYGSSCGRRVNSTRFLA